MQNHIRLNKLLRLIGVRVETFASAEEFLSSGSRSPEAGRPISASAIPIVFITGHGDIPMAVQAMKAGAVESLTQPFREQELLDAVQRALEHDRAARSHPAEGEGLRGRSTR